jgi:hypothetical protein
MPSVKLAVRFVISVNRVAKPLAIFQHKMSTSDAFRRRLEKILNRKSASSYSPSSANSNFEKSRMTDVSTIPGVPTVTSEAADALRAVKLSERIRYIHCEDGHGVMVFTSKGGNPLFVKEVQTQDDFRLNFSVFRMMEDLG